MKLPVFATVGLILATAIGLAIGGLMFIWVFINFELEHMVFKLSDFGFSTIAIGLIVVALLYAWLTGAILSVLSIAYGRLTDTPLVPAGPEGHSDPQT